MQRDLGGSAKRQRVCSGNAALRSCRVPSYSYLHSAAAKTAAEERVVCTNCLPAPVLWSASRETGSSTGGVLPTWFPAVEVHPLHNPEVHIPPKPVAEELAQRCLLLSCPSWKGMISWLLPLGTSCRRKMKKARRIGVQDLASDHNILESGFYVSLCNGSWHCVTAVIYFNWENLKTKRQLSFN